MNSPSPSVFVSCLRVLFLILSKIRREGLMAVEADVEEPERSAIFAAYPELREHRHQFEFLRDMLRLMVGGNLDHEIVSLFADTARLSFLRTDNPDIALWECIRATLMASLHGCAPQVAVEFGRQAIPWEDRPSFEELEALLKNAQPSKSEYTEPDASGTLERSVEEWFATMRAS